MDVLNRKSLLLTMALCMSGGVLAQAPHANAPTVPPAAPKAGPYDCLGLAGVALRNCMDSNAAAANAGSNTPSASHDCGGMTGAALATCRELNGEQPAPPVNLYNPGAYGNYGTPGYTPGIAPTTVPPAGNGNSGTSGATGSSSGSNPTGISPGSGTTGSSSGSNPMGMSGGSGKSPSGSVTAPEKGAAETGSNANSSAGGKSGM